MPKKQDKPIVIDERLVKYSPKSTQAQLSQRVTEVQALLLQGFTRCYLLQYGAKWKISPRQMDEYISMATIQIKEINMLSIQDNMALISSNLWDLFRVAGKDNNRSEQHKILMSIAKIRGIDQHAITHIIEDRRELESLSDLELEQLLEQPDAIE